MIDTKNIECHEGTSPSSSDVEQGTNRNYSIINGEFPVIIFPDSICELIRNAHETVGYNVDYFSVAIISACATALGGSNVIDIKQYQATAIFWFALVGNSGDGKTHPLESALKYFKRNDEIEYDNYKSLMNDWQKAQKKGPKPIYKSTVLKNFTIEALASKLQYNPNLLLYRDELMGWINSFNQYSKGSDQQDFLELFNGHGITVERKTSEPINTKTSSINIIGGIQKKKLHSLSKNDRDSDGFIERILFAVPDNVSIPKKTFKKQGEQHQEKLIRTLEALSQINNKVFTLDSECEEIYGKWYNEAIETYGSCSIQAKLDTYVPRFALIIDVLQKIENNDNGTIIYPSSFKKAIMAIEYFRKTAIKVKGIIKNGTNPLEDLALKYQKLYHDLEPEFTVANEIEKFNHHQVKGGSIYAFLNKKELFIKLEHKVWKKRN